MPFYNTIYAFPKPKMVEQIEMDLSYITFLSVGTLTTAKGQDNVCQFMEAILGGCTKKVRWICVGRGPMHEQITAIAGELEREYKNFTFVYLPKVEFAEMQYLYSIADIYIMLHRIAVFDLATLEAMKQSCAVILSPVGGNLELNVSGNIVYSNSDMKELLALLDDEKLSVMKEKNRDAYETYFSEHCFRERYESLILQTIEMINQKKQGDVEERYILAVRNTHTI